MTDILLFLSIPFLVIIFGVLTWRGAGKAYKIIRVTNTLGEEKYEVYFQYESRDFSSCNWRLEETFETEQLANEFIARQFQTREVIREGKLK